MSNFVNDIIKNANDQIKYKETVVTGEVTADNGDGTYDVKIANSPTAYPNVETATYGDTFSVSEIAIITFEYGNKEMPRLWGHAKKIKQEPVNVEVDYSGEEGGGVQEETVTVYGDTADGVISNINSPYSLAHDDNGELLDADVWADGDFIYIGQEDIMGLYAIYRGYLFFDTSVIPSNAIITSVKLSIYVETDSSVTDFNIVIQDGQPNYPSSTLVGIDFNYTKYHNNGGQVSTSGISTIAYTVITLTSNGMAWVNKGGITKFCIRSSRDIASMAPSGDEYIQIYSADKGGDYRPKLVITYTI